MALNEIMEGPPPVLDSDRTEPQEPVDAQPTPVLSDAEIIARATELGFVRNEPQQHQQQEDPFEKYADDSQAFYDNPAQALREAAEHGARMAMQHMAPIIGPAANQTFVSTIAGGDQAIQAEIAKMLRNSPPDQVRVIASDPEAASVLRDAAAFRSQQAKARSPKASPTAAQSFTSPEARQAEETLAALYGPEVAKAYKEGSYGN